MGRHRRSGEHVRPEDEFNIGHLPSALNIPLAQLERRFAELPANREIVAYCRGPWCVLSFEAVALPRNKGYRARRVEDGFPEWKMAGLPVSWTQLPRSWPSPDGKGGMWK
jgi:rhodanese-related sulfurtransferase